MLHRRLKGVAPAAVLVALPFALTGCASTPPAHALRLHDTYVVESLPQPEYEEAWFGIPLDNTAGSTVTIESMRLLHASNLVAGKPFVIDITHGDYIDWYSPPGTKPMQDEIAKSAPLAGFKIPPHTRHRFEAILLATTRARGSLASLKGGVIRYAIDGHSQQESWLERASLTASQ